MKIWLSPMLPVRFNSRSVSPLCGLSACTTSVFILVAYISMFPLQGMLLVKMDYTSPIDPEVERACETGTWWRKAMNRVRRGKPMAWELARDTGKDKEDLQIGMLDAKKKNGCSVEEPSALAKSPSDGCVGAGHRQSLEYLMQG